MRLRILAGLCVAVAVLAGSIGRSGPLPLDEQRALAEKNGFRVSPGPDAAGPNDPAVRFDEKAAAAGAAVFVRDYNLPLYPDSHIAQAELDAPAAIDAARGQLEPLSLGVRAIDDLKGLTLSVGPLTGPGGAVLPAGGVRVRYLEDAYIQGGGRGRRRPTTRPAGGPTSRPTTRPARGAGLGGGAGRPAVLTPLRLRPIEPLPLAKGANRQFWIDVAVPAAAAPGDYVGVIRVASDGKPAVERTLTVHVRRFALVEPKDFFLGAFMSLTLNPGRAALADFKAHGIDAMLWFWNDHNSWIVTRDGDTIKQDFEHSPFARLVDDAVAVGMKGPIVVALGNDTKGFYEKKLLDLFGHKIRPAVEVDGKTAQVAALDDELINKLYAEGIRQLDQFVKSKKGWPEVVILHYDEATERLMPEATFRYKQIKQTAPNMRVYGVTMSSLSLAEEVAPISDILVCNGDFARTRDLGKKLGKDVWGYTGAGATMGAGGARFNMGFRLWQYGLKAHWFWCYDFYPSGPWNEFEGRAACAAWVNAYPAEVKGDHLPTPAWEGIGMAYQDIRYAATLVELLGKESGPVRDDIAAKYAKFLAGVPSGRDQTTTRVDQDNFYSTLPSYQGLTAMRRQLAEWIEQLAE